MTSFAMIAAAIGCILVLSLVVGRRPRKAGIGEVKTGAAPEIGFFSAVRVFSASQLRGSSSFGWTGEYLFYDCTGAHCAEPAVYLRRAGAASLDYRAARGATDANRHLPG